MGLNNSHTHYKVTVVTGNQKHAGTDSDIHLRIHDNAGNITEFVKLNHVLQDNFERARVDNFAVPRMLRSDRDPGLAAITLRRGTFGVYPDWYCDRVEIHDQVKQERYVFPVQRWVDSHVDYYIPLNDTSLPQKDQFPELRSRVLERKRGSYTVEFPEIGYPPRLDRLPIEELLTDEYKWDIVARKIKLTVVAKLNNLQKTKWKSIDDIKTIYNKTFKMPKSASRDLWLSDEAFGAQRLVCSNPRTIRGCVNGLPKNFQLDKKEIELFLEGTTFDEAVERKRIYFVDHKICENINTIEDHVLCAPIAFFFVNEMKKLVPVAIQLKQQPGPENPVFYPNDPKYTWLMAKLWFNHSDANVHQSLTHLGLTHLLMEGFCISMNHQLSPNHPIYRLLASHFLFLLPMNFRGVKKLISIGGWVDKTLTPGATGFAQLIDKGVRSWRQTVEGTLPEFFKQNGLWGLETLPNYSYRDDAILYYTAINKYVTSVVNIYYTCKDDVLNDNELQNWGEQMARSREKGGFEIGGLPNSDGSFTTVDDIISVATTVIVTCSVEHAASNFHQYEDYGFPLYFPSILKGAPPKNKNPLNESDLLNAVCDPQQLADVMIISSLLSELGTNRLGDWETPHQFDPKALEAEQVFREDLKHIGEVIEERNKKRPELYKYDILNPKYVPNAISI